LHAVAFSPCGQRLATGSEDTTVILWEAQTGKAEHVLQGHTHIVSSLSFSADGAWLASGSWDGSIRVWDASGALLRTMVQAHNLVLGVQFCPTDGRRLASVGYDTILKHWDIDRDIDSELHFDGEGRRFALLSPDGHTIATGCPRTNDVLLIDTATMAIRLRLVAHLREVYSASFSVDGSKLASGSIDDTCKVWDSSTGALLNTIEIPGWNYSVWWGRDWVQEKQRSVAFAMGHHPRLGAGSQVLGLDEELLRMILDRV
jgi:WD40 repeat protein